MPDESEPHERTFMQWPVSHAVHPDDTFRSTLQQAIADVANTIAEFEPVVMLMDGRYESAAHDMLGQHVEIWHISRDDFWCRDSGPIFVTNETGDIAIAHIKFNGWGNKQVHPHDRRIAERIAKDLGIPLIESGIVGEAGGDDTLLAHESSWVNPNRNRISPDVIEDRLFQALGAEKMIWSPGVKGSDITDYHIDALARFVRPGIMVTQLPDEVDDQDPWTTSAFETYDILQGSKDAKGRSLELIALAEPYLTRVRSAKFVASYVNYYVCNGAVITAQFGDHEADSHARTTLQRLYPGREIIALNVDPIGEVGGGIHCATQQQPKV